MGIDRPGFDEGRVALDAAVTAEPRRADLDDHVRFDVEPGGLKVDGDEFFQQEGAFP
jgi:hypothetical protein